MAFFVNVGDEWLTISDNESRITNHVNVPRVWSNNIKSQSV